MKKWIAVLATAMLLALVSPAPVLADGTCNGSTHLGIATGGKWKAFGTTSCTVSHKYTNVWVAMQRRVVGSTTWSTFEYADKTTTNSKVASTATVGRVLDCDYYDYRSEMQGNQINLAGNVHNHVNAYSSILSSC